MGTESASMTITGHMLIYSGRTFALHIRTKEIRMRILCFTLCSLQVVLLLHALPVTNYLVNYGYLDEKLKHDLKAFENALKTKWPTCNLSYIIVNGPNYTFNLKKSDLAALVKKAFNVIITLF
ncbi:hypothetical protein HELRODRAFT_169272 [Helobdella robusta]|uniref:Uncharacterized protein n=1 Tax=Helobdella robusta TaxID=6412 RepID=T1F1P3_HELRO|nr:hypothetical protein HELRODRAFT_169272 [Helobdella robusta]ESO08430.1 hypothetical protein HELRODRAFT_169272 [Helobdella robusta]